MSPHIMHFFENAEFISGGMADWSISGIGMLYIYCQNLVDPVLVVPVNIGATLDLNRGRAWVGFTAATGVHTWQVHDVLQWTFSSLREDFEYIPPTVANEEGAYA